MKPLGLLVLLVASFGLGMQAQSKDRTLRVFVGPGKDVTFGFCIDRGNLADILAVLLSNDKPEVKKKLDAIFKESGRITVVMSSDPDMKAPAGSQEK
jgi:hypothetical protein